MDTYIFKNMIAVIRTEQEQRTSQLKYQDPNIAYDQWLFTDQPFINELCLMLLVALRHQVERELVGLAAQANECEKEISAQQYKEKVEQLRKIEKNGKSIYWDWKKIKKRLNLKSYEQYKFAKVLCLLSNSYKHDPSMTPNKELIELLQLETGVNYATLPESDALRKGLANFTGLGKDVDYCDIAERFVDIASDFLSKVRSGTKLSKVKVSLHPNDFTQ